MLRRFYELREEVFHFMEEKGKPVFHLNDPLWLCDLAFLIDITQYLNNLNSKYKEKISLFTIYLTSFALLKESSRYGKNN